MPAFEVTVRVRDDVRSELSAMGAADTPAMSSIPSVAPGSIPGPALGSIPTSTGSPTAEDVGDVSPLSGR